MRRINIQRLNKVKTVSFDSVEELSKYLTDSCFVSNASIVANKIWNLNVGSALERNNLRFSIQSKARVGNQLVL